MDKIEALYNLYLEQGIITSETTLEQFSQANPEIQENLYDLGKGSGLFETTELELFQSAWSDVKKKDDLVSVGQEAVTESTIPQQQEDVVTSEYTAPTTTIDRQYQSDTQVSVEEDTAIERAFGKNELTDLFGDMYRAGVQGQAQGGSVDEALRLFSEGSDVSDEDIQEFITAQERMAATGVSDEMRDFQEVYQDNGGGWLGFVKGVAKNPTVIPQLFVSSVSAMLTPEVLKGAGVGAAGGAMVGGVPGALIGAMGMAGTTLETGLTYAELLQEQLEGKPMTTENIRAVLEDEEAMKKIKFKAVGRGLTIGTVDAITGGLAGKLTTQLAKTGKKLAATAAGIGTEAVGGSLGEVAGRVVAGQEMDVAEIGFEGIAGTATAPLTVGYGLYKAPKYYLNGTDNKAKVSGKQMSDFIKEASPSDLINADVKIVNNPELEAEYTKKYQEAVTKKDISEADPEMNQPTLDAITELQVELNNLKGKDNQVAKDRAKVIREEIKNLQENPLKEEADAIQEPSAETVDVREQAAVSETVGEGDADVTAVTEEVTQEDIQEQDVSPELQSEVDKAIADEQLDLTELDQAITEETATEQDVTEEAATEQAVTEEVTPEITEQEEIQKMVDDVTENYEGDIEEIQEEISIEKGNTKSGVDEFKRLIKETKENKDLTLTQRLSELENLREQLSEFKEDQQNILSIYKEDISDKKREMRSEISFNKKEIKRSRKKSKQKVAPSIDVKNQKNVNELLNRVDDSKKTIVQQAIKAANTLKSILPNFNIVVHESNEAYNAKMREINTDENTLGNFSYSVDENGNFVGSIDINLDKADTRTVFHEVAHGVMLKAFGESTETFNDFRNKVSMILKSDDNKALSAFADEYATDVSAEEYLVELTAKLAEEAETISPSTIQKVAAIINDFVSNLTGGNVVLFENLSNINEITEFFNTISKNIAEGEAVDVDTFEKLDNGTNPIGTPTEIVRPSKSKKISFKESYENSLIKPENKVDLMKLVDEIISKKQKIWFWVADQLGVNNEIDGGPSFPFQKEGDVWASSMSVDRIRKNIDRTEYIFIISGSPKVSKLFNKKVYDVMTSKLGDFNVFKKAALDAKPPKAIVDVLGKYDSWEQLRESTDRKPFLIAIEKTKNTPNTTLTKYIKSIDGYTDIDALRDGFYRENNFEQNDVMLVLKPTGAREGANHSTYGNTVEGEVVGVPDVKLDALQLMPQEMREKYEGRRSQASQAIAPYGSGVKDIKSKQRKATPAMKLGQQYNMNESGFMGRGIINIPLLKRKAANIGLGVKQASNGNYYFTRNGRKFNPFAVSKARREATGPVKKFVEKARGLGYSDAAISALLTQRGVKTELVAEVVTTEKAAAPKPKLTEELAPGLKRLMKRMQEFKSADAAISALKKSALYKRATDNIKEQLVRDVRKQFGLKEKTAPTASKLLGAIRDVKRITLKETELLKIRLQEAVKAAKDAKNFIADTQQALSAEVDALIKKGTLTQRQASAILKKFAKTDVTKAKSVDAFIEYVAKVFNDSEGKYKKGVVKDILKFVTEKAKKAITDSNKARGKGLDAQGQQFFAAAKRVLKRILEGDFDAESIEKKFFPDIDEVLSKEGKLTVKEQNQLDAYIAFESFKGIEDMSVQEVEALLKDLKQARSESISILKEKLEAEKAEVKALRDEADSNIQQGYSALYNEDGSPLTEEQLRARQNERYNALMSGQLGKAFKLYVSEFPLTKPGKFLTGIANNLKHLGTLTNGLDKVGKFFTKNVYESLNAMESLYAKGLQGTRTKMDEIASSIDGVKNYKDIQSKLTSGTHKIDGITTGEGKDLGTNLFNADQLMRVYALSKNDVQREKLKKQGFTDEKLKQIESILGKDVVEFTDKVVEYLSTEYFEQTNDVYSDVNNVNLSYIENYFPTQTIKTKVDSKLLDEGDFNGVFNAQVAPALKERVDLTGDVSILNADFTTTLENHFETIERYKSYAKGVKKLNSIFKFKSVDTLLDQTGLGKVVRNSVNYAVNPNGGQQAIQPTIIDKLMTKYTGFALAFKLAQVVKQSTSFVNAFEDYSYKGKGKSKVPGLDLLMFMIDGAYTAATLPYQIQKAYNMSPMFKERVKKGLEGDVFGLETGSVTFKPIGKSNTMWGKAVRAFKTGAGSPTVLGDILGVMGYMINYNRDIANGMSEADALKKFENYNATQQSRRATEKIPLQMNSNSLVRGFTMFGSTLFLQMNKVMQGFTNVMSSASKGSIPTAKDARAIILNLGVANVMFALAANLAKFIKGDDEDRDEALLRMKDAMMGLNLIYQVPYFGAAIESAVNKSRGINRPADVAVNPFNSVMRKVKKLSKDDNPIEAASRVAVELTIGAQVDPFIGLYEGFTEGFDEDVMYDILGVSSSYRPSDGMNNAISKEALKKANPQMYKRLFGPGSTNYMQQQRLKQLKKSQER